MRCHGFRQAGRLAVLASIVFAAGCRQPKKQPAPAPVPVPKTKHAPATPIDAKRAEIGGPMWDPAWDKIVEDAVPPSMLSWRVPRDVRHFCPRFYSMKPVDKRAFWAYFFQALAGAEAGLKPRARVRHTEPAVAVTDSVTHRAVRSQGLLQLTYEDARRYGCDFDWHADKKLKPDSGAKTILTPKNNLECGVRILKHQIIDDHKPILSRTGYWSTLRPQTSSYHMFAKQMTNVPLACRTERWKERNSPKHPKEIAQR